ncbi:hypothetical protein HPT25_26320 [Bacillus sp. BRMEA1]|uniref:hypothetical protein n=1 Tax=Neobacillus endophyticus TaxID=2738405 RepID=UPI00156563DB|nr:hypothetical protein [Neobacillus endophyticus]NRD80847.1 hypothetical protein [Neobacillus endophyticus]
MKQYITIHFESDCMMDHHLRDCTLSTYSFSGVWLFHREEINIEIAENADIRMFLSVALLLNGVGIYLFDEDKDGNVYTGDWYEYPDLESAVLCSELPLEVSIRLKKEVSILDSLFNELGE